MGSICQTLNLVRRSTEYTAFVQCVDGRELLIHEVWSLGLDGIIREFHPTARVEVPSRTVGEFVTNYLSENGYIAHITRQLSINDSVQFLGVPVQSWGRRFPFLCNL